ncbi:FtsK/SpoIIIE domain-containing protein [Bacillus cereus group sp. BfR-BA-01331]|uniref:FtsK/SpoIIIE domain-containing protein n=1 Tax=Bacillus cereus group sp. BfR-BA-01331 TaxID=2920307 RepID=UPI001F567778|nr:FtsK/SpoIIIE domain-containing protein [Bacillus cereus group sp. BfR-BA-01331]
MEKIRLYFKSKQSTPYISLTEKNPNWVARLRILHVLTMVFLMTSMIVILNSWKSILTVLVPFVTVFLMFKINKYFKALKEQVIQWCYWRDKLLYFTRSNFLYQEDYEEYQEIDKNGNTRTKKKKYISNSAVFSYKETTDKIIIYAIKRGDNFSSKVINLDVELSALLNLPLEEKIDRPGVCEYHYFTKRPKRLYVRSTEKKEVNDSLNINLGYGVIYNPVKCPHILVAGGTGSGKSIFISFMILEFLKQDSSIWVLDPKHSDLGSLSHYLGEKRVATTPNNIARVVRLAITEMQERYNYMNKNFKYGSNFADHGFKPIWLVFDEMGAFQASGTDKKSKEIVNEVIDGGIKKIILLGRQAGVFILVAAQQMNANTLNTDLRDNLGLRIALGANSSDGYRMIFGSSTPERTPSIETKGAGLLYMQGAGKEAAQYWESPFIDTKNFDFIEELKRYI